MKKLLNSRLGIVLLFVLAVVLLLTGTIGGIRAAPLMESPFYTATVGMSDIGVTLLENGEAVGWRDYQGNSTGNWNERRGNLLANMLPEGGAVELGRVYPESLTVLNSGTIDIFVRVSLYCYWQDAAGNKLQTLDPSFIKLALLTDGWVIDESSSTPERTVLYYTRALAPGETTTPCCESLMIDAGLRAAVDENGNPMQASYQGVSFRVEAEVDAVQTHNAQDAIWSAWGRIVTVSENSLSLG